MLVPQAREREVGDDATCERAVHVCGSGCVWVVGCCGKLRGGRGFCTMRGASVDSTTCPGEAPRMAAKDKKDEPRKRVSKTNMLIGAAGLFLFIVGVKRGLRVDVPGVTEGVPLDVEPEPDGIL